MPVRLVTLPTDVVVVPVTWRWNRWFVTALKHKLSCAGAWPTMPARTLTTRAIRITGARSIVPLLRECVVPQLGRLAEHVSAGAPGHRHSLSTGADRGRGRPRV